MHYPAFMASFEFPCARCQDEVVDELLCLPCSVLSSHQKQFYNPQLKASLSLVEQQSVYVLGQVDRKKLEEIRRMHRLTSSLPA